MIISPRYLPIRFDTNNTKQTGMEGQSFLYETMVIHHVWPLELEKIHLAVYLICLFPPLNYPGTTFGLFFL
jgi:hypothetical protein